MTDWDPGQWVGVWKPLHLMKEFWGNNYYIDKIKTLLIEKKRQHKIKKIKKTHYEEKKTQNLPFVEN